MMRIIFFSLFLLISINSVFAQELLVRSDKYYTELFLKLDPADIASVNKTDGMLTINFSKKIKQPFKKAFRDKFIRSAEASGNKFVVVLRPDADVSVVNDTEGIKIVTSAKKTNSDIFLSYGVGSPLLNAEKSPEEDKAQRAMIDEAEKLITGKNFVEAARVLNNLLKVTRNDFYKQEALYRLGQVYLLLAQQNDVYLTNAYKAFDDFTTLYPDNFRTVEVLQKSAETKEKANQLFEALAAYQKIYDSSFDLETKRKALSKVAELYRTMGQYDKAVAAYEMYLKNYRSGADAANLNIGQIYYDLGDKNSAYEWFSLLDADKLGKDPEALSKNLFAVARTLEEYRKFDRALKLYIATYERFPDGKETNDAILRAADILRKTGKNADADALLLKLKNQFPDKLTGQKAAIEYAKKYLTTKNSDYWKEFFQDMLSREDVFNLHGEAKYLLIKAMSLEKKIDDTIAAIDTYLPQYPSSEYYKELDKIREDFTFSKGSGLFKGNDFAGADKVLRKFMADYPNSTYRVRSDIMVADILFDKVKKLYDTSKFKETITEAEKFLVDAPRGVATKNWFDLLDNASFKNTQSNFLTGDYPAARVGAKQYFTSFPKGKNVPQVTEIFENAVLTPMKSAYNGGNFQEAVTIFEGSRDFVGKSRNKNFKTDTTALAGLSLYKLGLVDNARKVYATMEVSDNPNYALLGYLLGDKGLEYPVDNFDEPTFTYLVEETGKRDKEFALRLVKQYKSNPKLAARLEYDIAKTITGEIKRQEILADVYDTIKANPDARFEGSANVFLDMGAMYFNKNDFKAAVFPLREFLDEYKTLDEKRAEALYYMGMSFSEMNDNDRALSYYNEIVQTMPQSFYAGVVKSRIEDELWKKGVKGR